MISKKEVQPIFKSKFIKVISIFIGLFILLLLFGFINENARGDAMENYEPVGDFVNHEGVKIHYVKKGAGEQTVLFSAGNGTTSPYIDMYHLQNELSAFTETIVYERPGYGWSDSPDSERSVENITTEMSKVLSEATSNQSFILVGHSIAALEIFHFAEKHPEKVDGVVLIDGVHPEYAAQMENAVPFSISVTKLLNRSGLFRLLSNVDSVKANFVQPKDLPEELNDMALDFSLNKMWNDTMIAEREKISANGELVSEGNHLGNIPLVVISAKDNPMDGWVESQETLPEWSGNAKQIWVETSNHSVHHEEPELIIEEIRQLIQK